MKEASGELNMTIVTVVAIAAVGLLFTAFVWPNIQSNLALSTACSQVDNNGNYEPKNCRWITLEEQQRNKSNNIYITYKNETHCINEWCRILNLSYREVKKLLYQ